MAHTFTNLLTHSIFSTKDRLPQIDSDLKTHLSKWVHDRWPERSKFAWQTGYGAFSVSKSNADAVFGYIADQEEHHRKKTFQEEFVEYLKRHEIEYDERYIWE
jgi:putative transposase